MKEESKKQGLSVMEAINILSDMSEIDIKHSLRKKSLGSDGFEESDLNENSENIHSELHYESIIREVFSLLHRHLQNMIRKDQNMLNDSQALKGIQAMMILAQEAVSKMDRYIRRNFNKNKEVSNFKEYKDLQKYYKQHILKQAPGKSEIPEDWEEDFEESKAAFESAKKKLSDLEIVRSDKHYELFYIQNENKSRYFSKNLLRHVRLIGNFDEFIGKVEGEDPVLHLREVFDKEFNLGAQETLQIIAPYVDEFYKGAKIEKKNFLAWNINKALMALRMSANAKNLIENESFKSCIEYYSDFHRFLRILINSSDYNKIISEETEENQFEHIMIRIIHMLCFQLFIRKEPQKNGMKFIHSMIKRGNELLGSREKKQSEISQLQVWTDFRDEDACIRYLLKHYPNGPVLKILDSFREEEELEGFDPFLHKNFPNLQFNIEGDSFHISVLRMACPTKQKIINKAEISKEFLGFLRFYKNDLKLGNHLIVNIQNRTSWEEVSRCKALETTSINAEIYNHMILLGLSVGTPFYNQEDEYESMGKASVFIEQFTTQILSGSDCGYFFSEKIQQHQYEDFTKDGIRICHKIFFDNKAYLSQKERLNFILIFYMMFTLKIIDLKKVDSVSFSCKDAVDTGASYAALFYVLIRLVSDPKGWNSVDQENVKWHLYSPALFIRERSIHEEVLNRVLMAMEQIHLGCLMKGNEITASCNKLYDNIKFPMKIK